MVALCWFNLTVNTATAAIWDTATRLKTLAIRHNPYDLEPNNSGVFDPSSAYSEVVEKIRQAVMAHPDVDMILLPEYTFNLYNPCSLKNDWDIHPECF